MIIVPANAQRLRRYDETARRDLARAHRLRQDGSGHPFLLQAIDRGYLGYFNTFPELLQELFQSLADRSDGKVFRRSLAYDCLVIDEVGFVEVKPAQVGQFFPLMHKRH